MLTLEKLAERVAELEDREALRELKHRYLMAADRHDLEGVRDCFAPDGAVIEFEGFPRCEGRDNLVAMMADQGGKPGFFTMHHGHNPTFAFTSRDEASGRWALYFCAIDAVGRQISEIGGVYHETYVRQEGRWYIQTSRFERQSLLVRSINETGSLSAAVLGLQNHG